MHLLPVTSVSLDEAERAVDLGQTPGDVAILSFSDSDLSAAAVAWEREKANLPSLRLASLKQLRHPLSVDLYVEQVVAKARFVVVRCLGGLDYWRYGIDQIFVFCREAGIRFAALPGDDRPDARLAERSTVAPALLAEIDGYWRAGGVDNLRQLLRRVANEIGVELAVEPPRGLPLGCAWSPQHGIEAPETAAARLPHNKPLAHILFYRSALLAGDTAPVEALCEALQGQGLSALPLAVSSLKEPEAAQAVREAIRARRPDIVLTLTAFSAREGDDFVLDDADVPVLQAIVSGSTEEAWRASDRGLPTPDLAMQVVLPEFDGRIVTGPIAFKAEAEQRPDLEFAPRLQRPFLDGAGAVARQAAAWVRLARTPAAERRLALVLSDYPARGGRAGYAVGLDTPASVRSVVQALAEAGYAVEPLPADLMAELTDGSTAIDVPLAAYDRWLAGLPGSLQEALRAGWGDPHADPSFQGGAFRFRAIRAQHLLIALQPARAHGLDRKAAYHDGELPPCHGYLAFHLALRETERVHALIQLGTHGTTEWLPGKSVALSQSCWPRVAVGDLPVVYPFIANDPGEAAPAKRRIGALTIGHLPPPVTAAGLHGEAAALRELVEEFSNARTMDPRRADLVGRAILERAEASGLAQDCGVGTATALDEALTALDAHLCDLAETPIRDGLHVFGAAPAPPLKADFAAEIAGAGGGDAQDIAVRLDASGEQERRSFLRALDGRFVAPGPAGSPARGHLDVLPTGRNLITLDPRAVPTRAATELGTRAAAEVVRRHLQDTGDWPRRIVMDLWASPTMRSGGEDLAHILALMGVRPTWDHASTRVTGFEILPLPLLDRPRTDVTVRISGAFRDTFPAQIALLDQASRAVAALDEEDEWNALAAARRRGEPLARIFGAPPGRYGAGVAAAALDGEWFSAAELGSAYLAASSHAYGGVAGTAGPDSSFAERVKGADAFVHVTDTPDRDILDGDDTAEAIGGFASALGRPIPLYSLDTSRPERPRVRTLEEDIARLVRGRLANPRWIEGQLRHGYSSAAELAQAVDSLFLFAATTRAVTGQQFDLVFDAFVGDERTYDRLFASNPKAAAAIVARFEEARERGLWTSRRNSIALRLSQLNPQREAAE